MKTSDVCIATISLARNNEEENLLRIALEQLADLKIPVYITDGGSSKEFICFIKNIPHFNVFEAKGLWPQAKKSITEAAKASKFIFYTEPDKLEFFINHSKSFLENITVDDTTGVVLASRSMKAFATFPAFQEMTETTINNCCKEAIGKEMDYSYGPFLFNTCLISYMKKLDDCGWGWRPFLFTIAHRLGLKIESYEGDFNCPLEQRADNASERIYRMKQLTQNIDGLVQAAIIDITKR